MPETLQEPQQEQPDYLRILENWKEMQEDNLDDHTDREWDMQYLVQEWNELEKEFVESVELLKEDILSERWSGLIADDTRARFPAMVIRSVISRANTSNKNLSLTYIAGYKHFLSDDGEYYTDERSSKAKESYDSYLRELEKHYAGKRVLIITERTDTAGNANHLIGEFNKHGIRTDLLSFGIGKYGQAKLDSLDKLDPEAKVYKPDVWGIDDLMDYFRYDQLGSLVYPLSKHHIGNDEPSAPHYHGKQIPAAAAQVESEEYKLLRELASRMADKVYQRVFAPAEPVEQHAESTQ